jgi:hypothetical protein
MKCKKCNVEMKEADKKKPRYEGYQGTQTSSQLITPKPPIKIKRFICLNCLWIDQEIIQ